MTSRGHRARRRAEAMFVRLLDAAGSRADELVLVGGLVPQTLVPEVPHQGTVDIDVVLTVAPIFDRDEQDFAWLEGALDRAGFVPASPSTVQQPPRLDAGKGGSRRGHRWISADEGRRGAPPRGAQGHLRLRVRRRASAVAARWRPRRDRGCRGPRSLEPAGRRARRRGRVPHVRRRGSACAAYAEEATLAGAQESAPDLRERARLAMAGLLADLERISR